METQAPASYAREWAAALQWPVIVVAAFWAGRYVSKLEVRVLKAERNVQDLIERHMPHLHAALAEIRNRLDVIQAMLSGRR